MFKKFLLCLIIALMLSVSAVMPMTASASDNIFSEDFESYALDAHPTTFTSLDHGSGISNQKIMSTLGFYEDITKVFRLEGMNSIASNQLMALTGIIPENLVVDSYIKPVAGQWPGRIGLWNVSTDYFRVSGVLFEGGKIKAVQNGNDSSKVELADYSTDRWYRVTMVHKTSAKTYDVYIDGIRLGSNIPMHQTKSATHLNLAAGNTGDGNEIYFDNIRLYSPYSVTFDRNSGNLEADPQSIIIIDPATNVGDLPVEPTKVSYDFDGWWTGNGNDSDGIGVDGGNGWGTEFLADTEITENITVYAKWALMENVCEIGGTGYTTLTQALTAVPDGGTVKLLRDIDYNSNIVCDTKSVIIDVNGYNLSVTSVSGHALKAVNNGSLKIFDGDGNGCLTVSVNSNFSAGAYTDSGGEIIITGNVTAAGTTFSSEVMGARANGGNITITGNVEGYNFGAYADNGGAVSINGNVTGTIYSVYATENGNIDVTGNVTALYWDGATAKTNSHVTITGNVTAGVNSSIGARAESASTITIDGDTQGTYTAVHAEGGSSVTVSGDASVTGNSGYVVFAGDDGEVRIGGDVTTSGTGPSAINGSHITINGIVSAYVSRYVFINYVEMTQQQNEAETTIEGYSTYTHNDSLYGMDPAYVWVKIPNQAPVVTSDWNYGTVYFGQEYPFNITVTDYENTLSTKLYRYIDHDAPILYWTFPDMPGNQIAEISPVKGVLSPGAHTLNFYAEDSNGAVSEILTLPFIIQDDNAALFGLTAAGISLTPGFSSEVVNYSANVEYSVSSTTITAMPFDIGATTKINGTQSTSQEIVIGVGNNRVLIDVTAQNGITTKNYTLDINRANNSSGGGGNSGYSPPNIIVTSEDINGTTKTGTDIPASTSSGKSKASITASVVKALLGKVEAGATNGISNESILEITVNTANDIKNLEVDIPQTELAKIASDTDSSFGITSPLIGITFDGKAIEVISGAVTGGIVVISAGIVDNATLAAEDRAKVEGRQVYHLGVKNGDEKVSDFGGGFATVRIPYTLKEGEKPNSVVVYYLADEGSLKTVRGHFDAAANMVIFKTKHFSRFAIGYNPVALSDVNKGTWYSNAIDFTAARGITSGMGDNKFSPDAKLNRGQFITFLMKAYQIEPVLIQLDGRDNFADAGNTYYTNHLAAAKSLGIAKGIGNNIFAPEQEITRQEMLVMLYNALNIINELPFTTVDKPLEAFHDADQVASWAKDALSALVKGGIISGTNNRLNPSAITSRAEMAQVIYNLLSK